MSSRLFILLGAFALSLFQLCCAQDTSPPASEWRESELNKFFIALFRQKESFVGAYPHPEPVFAFSKAAVHFWPLIVGEVFPLGEGQRAYLAKNRIKQMQIDRVLVTKEGTIAGESMFLALVNFSREGLPEKYLMRDGGGAGSGRFILEIERHAQGGVSLTKSVQKDPNATPEVVLELHFEPCEPGWRLRFSYRDKSSHFIFGRAGQLISCGMPGGHNGLFGNPSSDGVSNVLSHNSELSYGSDLKLQNLRKTGHQPEAYIAFDYHETPLYIKQARMVDFAADPFYYKFYRPPVFSHDKNTFSQTFTKYHMTLNTREWSTTLAYDTVEGAITATRRFSDMGESSREEYFVRFLDGRLIALAGLKSPSGAGSDQSDHIGTGLTMDSVGQITSITVGSHPGLSHSFLDGHYKLKGRKDGLAARVEMYRIPADANSNFLIHCDQAKFDYWE